VIEGDKAFEEISDACLVADIDDAAFSAGTQPRERGLDAGRMI
jgi:hypothetical protein